MFKKVVGGLEEEGKQLFTNLHLGARAFGREMRLDYLSANAFLSSPEKKIWLARETDQVAPRLIFAGGSGIQLLVYCFAFLRFRCSLACWFKLCSQFDFAHTLAHDSHVCVCFLQIRLTLHEHMPAGIFRPIFFEDGKTIQCSCWEVHIERKHRAVKNKCQEMGPAAPAYTLLPTPHYLLPTTHHLLPTYSITIDHPSVNESSING